MEGVSIRRCHVISRLVQLKIKSIDYPQLASGVSHTVRWALKFFSKCAIMAKTPSTHKEEINTDLSMDDDLDMADFEFSFEEPKDDRSPVTKAGSAALDAAVSQAFDSQYLKGKVLDTLPEGYGQTSDFASDIADRVGDTYDESVKAVKPAVKELKRTLIKAIPRDSAYVPDFLREKLDEWGDDIKGKRTEEQELAQSRENALESQIGSIFSAQFQQAEGMRKEDQARESIGEALAQERHKQGMRVSADSNQAISRIDQYLRSVNLEWQKKDLEIQYRQLFALQDLLKKTQEVGQITIDNLPKITKNTGLPDFVKQTNKEFLAEYQKNKFVEAIGRGLFGNSAEYLERGLTNLSKNVVGLVGKKANDFRNALSEMGGMLEMGGNEGGPSKEEMLGMMAGGTAAEKGMNYLYDKAKDKGYLKKISENEFLKKWGINLSRGVSNASRYAQDTQKKWSREGDDGSVLASIKSFVAKSFGQAATKQDVGIKSAADTVVPHDITHKTINEIIPGYLSRMLQELVIIRKGPNKREDPDNERLVFDYDKNDFVRRKELRESIRDKIAPNQDSKALAEKLDEILKIIGAKRMPAPVQRTLREGLARASASGVLPTEENLTESKLYKGKEANKAIAAVGDFFRMNGDDGATMLKFERLFDKIVDSMSNTRQAAFTHANLGQSKEMKELGFLSDDNKFTSHGVLDYQLSRMDDPTVEQKKKKTSTTADGGKVQPASASSATVASLSPSAPPSVTPPVAPPTSQQFAKGGLVQSLGRLSGQVFGSDKPFAYLENGLRKTGLLGEAGPEAILPAPGGEVQAVNADGTKAGTLPVTRDVSGKLSVQAPENKTKKDNLATMSQDQYTKFEQAWTRAKESHEPARKMLALGGKLERNGVLDYISDYSKEVGKPMNLSSWKGWENLTDGELLEAHANFDTYMAQRRFIKENLGDRASPTLDRLDRDFFVHVRERIKAARRENGQADAKTVLDAVSQSTQQASESLKGFAKKAAERPLKRGLAKVYDKISENISEHKASAPEKARRMAVKAKLNARASGRKIKQAQVYVENTEFGQIRDDAQQAIQSRVDQGLHFALGDEHAQRVKDKLSEIKEGAKARLDDVLTDAKSMDWSGQERSREKTKSILENFSQSAFSTELARNTLQSRLGEFSSKYADILTPSNAEKFAEFGQQKVSDYIRQYGEPTRPEDLGKFDEFVTKELHEHLETLDDSYQGAKGFARKVWDRLISFFSGLGGNLGKLIDKGTDLLGSAVSVTSLGQRVKFAKDMAALIERFGPYTYEENKNLTEFCNLSRQAYEQEFGAPESAQDFENFFVHALNKTGEYLKELRKHNPAFKEKINATKLIDPRQMLSGQSYLRKIKDQALGYASELGIFEPKQEDNVSTRDETFVGPLKPTLAQTVGQRAREAGQKIKSLIPTQFLGDDVSAQAAAQSEQVLPVQEGEPNEGFVSQVRRKITQSTLASKASELIERYTPDLTKEDPARLSKYAQKVLKEYVGRNGEPQTPEQTKKAEEHVLSKLGTYFQQLAQKKPNASGKLKSVWDNATARVQDWGKAAGERATSLLNELPTPNVQHHDNPQQALEQHQDRVEQASDSILSQASKVKTLKEFEVFTQDVHERIQAIVGQAFDSIKQTGQKVSATLGDIKQGTGERLGDLKASMMPSNGDEKTHGILEEIRDVLYGIEDQLAGAGKGGSKWYNPLSWGRGKGQQYEPELDQTGQPILDENGQPKMRPKRGYVKRTADGAVRGVAAVGRGAKSFGGGVVGLVGSVAAGATSLTGSAIKNTASAVGWVGKKNIQAISWTGKKVIDFIKDPLDVYVEGERQPRLIGALFKEGKTYFKKKSGKPVKDHSDVNDAVVDNKGQILIAEEELGKIYTKGIGARAYRLGKGAFGLAGKLASGIGRGMLSTAKLVPWTAKAMWSGTKATLGAVKKTYEFFGDGPDDVYTPGIDSPVLLKKPMHMGHYVSKLTGQPITKPTEIDGAVLDLQGEEVLSLDQFRKGVFNKDGKKFKTTTRKIASALGGVAKGILKAQGMAWRASKAIGRGLLKGIGGLGKWALGGFSLEINGAKTRAVLEEIRDMLKAKFAQDNPLFGDQDGDGDRDNSAKDIMEKNKLRDEEKKKSFKERLGAAGEKLKKAKQDTQTSIMDTLGKVGSAISGLVDAAKGIGGVGKMITGLFTGGGKAGMLARMAGGAASLFGLGGGAAAAAGSVATAGAAAAGASGALATGAAGASAAAGAAGAVGAAAAGTAGTVAAGAGAAAMLPVALAALGVAAVGYGGYKIYKWATTSKLTTLDNYRLVQYGYKWGDEKSYAQVAKLEALISKNLAGEGVINEQNIKVEDIADIFDLGSGWFKSNATENKELRAVLAWYQARFKPVFLANLRGLGAAQNTQVKNLTGIASLKGVEASTYLNKARVGDEVYAHPLAIEQQKASGPSDVKQAEQRIRLEMKLPAPGETEKTPSKSLTEPSERTKALQKVNEDALGGASFSEAATAVSTASVAVKENGQKLANVATDGKVGDGGDGSLWSYVKKAGILGLGAATVGLPATAILAGGYAAYKYGPGALGQLKDWWSLPKSNLIDALRMTQYGVDSGNSEHTTKVRKLEKMIFALISKRGESFHIDDKKIPVEHLQRIFGLDASNSEQLGRFYTWYERRFKPVFIHNLALAQRVSNKRELAEVFPGLEQAKTSHLAHYVNQASSFKVDESTVFPYQGKGQSPQDLKVTLAAIRKLYGLDGVTPVDPNQGERVITQLGASGGVQSPVGGGDISQDRSGKIDYGQKLTASAAAISVESVADARLKTEADGDEYLDETTMEQLSSIASTKQEGRYTATMAVYYKSLGMKELDQDKIRAINNLMEHVSSEITVTGGKAQWSGSATRAMQATKASFNLVDVDGEHGKAWVSWFLKRFIPMHLKAISLYCSYTGAKNWQGSFDGLKANQQLDVAKQLAAMQEWSNAPSPWWGYTLNLDPKVTLPNLTFLDQLVKREIATEERAAERKAQGQREQDKAGAKAKPPQENARGRIKQEGMDGHQTSAQDSGEVGDSPKPTATATDISNQGGKAQPGQLKHASGDLLDGAGGRGSVTMAGSNIKLDGINPGMQRLFFGMAQEYQQLTGKKIPVTDGYRTYEDQVRMKEKYGARAATPGTSLHGFGVAIDADSAALNKAEDLGLLRKYGLTRPIGGEPWHVEPIGVQFDFERYKKDPYAAEAVIMEGVGRGGGGFGTVKNSPLGKRNFDMSRAIYEQKTTPNVQIDGVKPTVSVDTSLDDLEKRAIGLASGKTTSKGAKAFAPDVPSGGSVTESKGLPQSNTDTALPLSASGDSPKPSTPVSQQAVKPVDGQKLANQVIHNTAGVTPAASPSEKGLARVPEPTGDKQSVVKTVREAAKGVGVDENLATTTAAIESGLDPSAKSNSSSASGLFQFINKTWQAMLSKYGKPYGLFPGHSPFDARANAIMGAHYLKENESALVRSGADDKVDSTDAYMAHFLGAGGASVFLKALKSNPNQEAAAILPDAAQSNKSIFYDLRRPRTLAEVRRLLEEKVRTKAQQHGVQPVTSSTPMGSSPAKNEPIAKPTPLGAGGEVVQRTTGTTQSTSAPATNEPTARRSEFMKRAMVSQKEMDDVAPVLSLWGGAAGAQDVKKQITPAAREANRVASPPGTPDEAASVDNPQKNLPSDLATQVSRFNPSAILKQARQLEIEQARQVQQPRISMDATNGILNKQLHVTEEILNVLKGMREAMEWRRGEIVKQPVQPEQAKQTHTKAQNQLPDARGTMRRPTQVSMSQWEIPTSRNV